MPPRILVINPNSTQAVTDGIGSIDVREHHGAVRVIDKDIDRRSACISE